MATVAKNLPLQKGDNIIVAAEQFPSNYYAWKEICEEKGAELRVVGPPPVLNKRGEGWNTRILEAIDAETAAVALGHVHWADGTLFNLQAIRNRTRETGALLIIDGTQSVGALPFDVRSIQPDALVCAGYKWLLGPYSIGLAYYGDAFRDGKPVEENWINRADSEDFSGLVRYKDAYQPGAHRFSVGEQSNFILVPMMLSALQQLNRWKPEEINRYCESISTAPLERLREYGYWVEDSSFRSPHLFGVRVPGTVDIGSIKTRLTKKKIFVSFRGDAIRVSPNIYNSADDLEKFARALKP